MRGWNAMKDKEQNVFNTFLNNINTDCEDGKYSCNCIDKEKQIKEMASDIYYAIKKECKLNTYGHCNDCEFNVPENTNEIDCQSYLVSKILSQMNYRKLPEDSVVLSKKELDELYNDKLRSMYKDAYDTAYDSLRADLEKGKAIVLSENSVVLSKEEYEKLKSRADNKCRYDCDLIDMPDFEREKTLIEKTSKETAEKILKDIMFCIDINDCNKNEILILNLCKMLAKQFGVEIKD